VSEVSRLLDEYGTLSASAENQRRLSLWETTDCGLRAETQWHGIPNYTIASGRPMPVTAECLEKIWEAVLGMDLRRFYTEPDYFLEFFLKYKILKFRRFADDTPLTRDIPVCFGVTHEAGMLGQRVIYLPGQEPQLAKEPIVDENTDLPTTFDFSENPFLRMAISYYERVKAIAGREFRVIFPHWYRGPQGVALYIRGFENFSIDMYENPAFAHRLLRYVTDAAKQFAQWRADFTAEPIVPCDLFNDDIPLMSPRSYAQFFLPYERELSEFFGGVYYWHSCGDITEHVPELRRLPGIHLLDFGVSMEDKAKGLAELAVAGSHPCGPRAIEFRVMAQRHIQEAAEPEQKAYIRTILRGCHAHGVTRYILRSSGMSLLLGGEPDLARLARWVDLVREVQAEKD
jgi:uroporphyrinogen-III decarboxylase